MNAQADVGFDKGDVIIVTGGGRGLGRSHCLELALRGARVVVNDLGVSTDGSGEDASPAELVVKEIESIGGEAIADHSDISKIEGGKQVVQTALDHFGALQGVVNNAGILRDDYFHKTPMEAINAVLGVHLHGAFHVTHAAWPYLREQNYGRIVFTTSASGLWGNASQVNYGAGKMGLVGMMRALHQEGPRSGILVNAIAPVGDTRMTHDLKSMPQELLAATQPETVSPIVAGLMSPLCNFSGRIFTIEGGHIAEALVVETTGWTSQEPVTAESFLRHIDDIGERSELVAHDSMMAAVIAGASALGLV